MTASDKAPTALAVCLNTTPAHISHMKAVSPACRLESMVIEDEAHAIINDPLEAPMTPGPGNREYRTPDHVKATDRTLAAYDRQLFAFHRRVWNLAHTENLLYLEARDILIGRLHTEALQDDFVRDLGKPWTYDRQLSEFTHRVLEAGSGMHRYLTGRDILMNRLHAEALQDDFVRDLNANRAAAVTKLHRAHTEAQREQAYLIIQDLRQVCVGREHWAQEVIRYANRQGQGDLSSALIHLLDEDYAEAERKNAAFNRFVARLV